MADYTREQLMTALRNAHNAGDTIGARRIATMIQAQGQQATPQAATQAATQAAPPPAQSAQAEPMTALLSPETASMLGAGGGQEITEASQALSPGVTVPEALLQPARHGGPRSIDAFAERGFSEAVANIGDDGVILRNPQSGALVFTSPGRNISDQSLVEEMLGDRDMSGAQREDARVTLDMNPDWKLGGGAANFLAGVPFLGSYVDEAFGRLQGEEKGQRVREGRALYETAYPNRATALKIGGALTAAPLAIEAAPAVLGSGGILTQMVRGALGGAGLGALEGVIYGYGEGEGEGEGRADQAKRNALTGGFLGGVIGGFLPLSGGIARTLYNSVAGRKARKAAKALGLRQNVAGLLADRVRADAPYAQQYLAQAGDSATLGGLGPSTRGLLDSVANAPGQSAAIARRNVEGIVEDASSRFTQTLDDVLGQPQGPRSLQQGVMDASRPARKEAYDAAYQTPIDYASEAGVQLEGLLSRVDEGLIRRAERLMRAEGVSSQQIKATIDDAGRVIFDTLPDVRQIDYITRALKDTGSFGGGLGPDEARVVKGLASQIRTTLDDLAPAYREARSVAADAISEREAVKFGRDLLRPSVTREDAALEVLGMGKAELRRAREGLRSQIDDAMANVRRGLTRTGSDPQSVLKPLRDLTSPAAREKVAAILGSNETSRLFAMLDETEQAFSMRIVAGSQTAPRQQTERAIRELVPQRFSDEVIERGATGALSSVVGRAARFGSQTREQSMDEIRAHLAQALTDRGNVASRVQQLNEFADIGSRIQAGQVTAQRVGEQIGSATLAPGFSIRPEANNRPATLRRLAEAGYSSGQIVSIMQAGPRAIEQALTTPVR